MRPLGRASLSLFPAPSESDSGCLASTAPLPRLGPLRRPSAVRGAASTSVICLPWCLPSGSESRPYRGRYRTARRRGIHDE